MLLYAAGGGGASQVRVYNLERGLGFRWVGLGEIECESDSCPTSVQTSKDGGGEARGDMCQAESGNSQLTYCAQIDSCCFLPFLQVVTPFKGKS